MTKINAFALGGLNEVGKNCFVIEIDQDIFIFDCGAKILSELDLGVNMLIPDFQYLVENQERIKGLFVTKIDINNAYGINFLITAIPGLKIFMSKISHEIFMMENIVNKNQIQHNVRVIDDKKIKFGSNYIHNFYTASNMPGSCGYTLETKVGNIIYTGSFLFENNINSKIFNTQFNEIVSDHSKPVLLLITNVSQVYLKTFTVPNNGVVNWMTSSLMKVKNNLIVCCDQYDWHKIYQVFKQLTHFKEKQIKISFFDHHFEKKFLTVMKPFIAKEQLQNVIKMQQIKRQDDVINVIFLTGNHKWLFSRMFRMIANRNPDIALTENDYVLILGESVFNNELSMTKALNNLTKKDAAVEFISNKKIIPSEASAEDIKLLINLLHPKYFWPNNTYHKHLETARDLAKETGIPENRVLVCDNGEIMYLENTKQIEKYHALSLESVFVDNVTNINLTNNIVNERKILAEEGVVFVAISGKIQKNNIIPNAQLQIKTFGVTHNAEKIALITKEVTEWTNKKLSEIKTKDFKKQIWLKEVKREISKIVRKQTNKFPVVLPTLTITQTNE